MKKLLLLVGLLTLVGCGDKVYTPDHKAQIDDNTNRIAQLEQRVSNLEGNVSSLSDDLDSLTVTVSLNTADIASLETQLQTEIDERETADRELLRKIRKANQKRRALARRFKRFKRRQNRINQRLSNGLQSLSDFTINNISDLNSAISSLQASDGLQYFLMVSGFLYLDGKINSVEQSLSSRIDNLSISDISGLNDALDTLQDNIDNLEIEDISGLQAALDSLSSSIDDVQSEVDGLDIADIGGLQAELDDLQTQIDNLPTSSGGGDCQLETKDVSYGYFFNRADIYVDCGSLGEFRLKNNQILD